MSLRTALPGNERNPEHVSSRIRLQRDIDFLLNFKKNPIEFAHPGVVVFS